MTNQERLGDLCEFFFYSDASGRRRKSADAYLTERIAYPDAGSRFDNRLGAIKFLFRLPQAEKLVTPIGMAIALKAGRNALLLERHGHLIGYVAFHDHADKTRHIFGVEVQKDCQRQGLGTFMVEKILDRARNEGFERLRIGGGHNDGTNTICENFGRRSLALGIAMEPGNWLRILRPDEIQN